MRIQTDHTVDPIAREYHKTAKEQTASTKQSLHNQPQTGTDTITISKQAQELAQKEKSQPTHPQKNELQKEVALSEKRVMSLPGGAKYVIATGREIKSSAAKLVDEIS